MSSWLLPLLPLIILLHLFYSPYTKVEESFNLQAIHDIIEYGIPFAHASRKLALQYDHMTFPGAVPRSFIGALVIAEASKPWARWLASGEQIQIFARAVLGISNSLALLALHDSVKQAFGKVAGSWFILLTASQFHVMYYASRTIPNMFAFALSSSVLLLALVIKSDGFVGNLSLRYLILCRFGSRQRRSSRCRYALICVTVAGVVFRSELALLLACQVAALVKWRQASLTRLIIPTGLATATISLLLTVSVDSFFWQQFPLWPEWVAFRFNTLQGKSADWGISPFHFYFTNSIPRLMLNPMSWMVCIPTALLNPSVGKFSATFIWPLLSFVAFFSILPHKEWRFIVYVVPGLTVVASAGASCIWTRSTRSVICRFLAIGLLVSTLISFVASFSLLHISSLNYPGALALKRLHELADGSQPRITVHLDNLSCQTGITRFLELKSSSSSVAATGKSNWTYDKTEKSHDLADPSFWDRFDYALAEDPRAVIGSWDVIDTIYGFDGISFSRRVSNLTTAGIGKESLASAKGLWDTIDTWLSARLFIDIRMAPKIHILRLQGVDVNKR